MRLKLDEHLGARGAAMLRAAGYDVARVPSQDLYSATDASLITACKEEARCLVTLDLDFGNPLPFKPADYAGIAVLRLGPKPMSGDLLEAVRTLASALAGAEIHGKPWIVQRERIREYVPEGGTDA